MSTRPGQAFLFITLFILEGDNNNKNNRLDLNGSKGNINIPLLYYFFFDSWTAILYPEEASLYICVLCLRLHSWFKNDACL